MPVVWEEASDLVGTGPPRRTCLQGYLTHKKTASPSWAHRSALGMHFGLLRGPRRRQFLISEVPLCRAGVLFPHVQFLGPLPSVQRTR